jgi:glycosyltransferase involved in cell wall biosynthesis
MVMVHPNGKARPLRGTFSPSAAAPSAEAPPAVATVCQLLHSLDVGGAEVLAARLARGLLGTHRFVFACLDGLGPLGEELRGEGFPVEVLGRRPGTDWGCVRRLAGLLRRERVDLIHAHQYTPFFYGVTARLLCRRPPVLFTEHGRWYPDRRRVKRVVANRLLIERRDRVVGVGESVRRALIGNEGIPAGRVGVVYNGIDLSAFSGPAPDRILVRREMGVSDGDLVALQVARLDSLKDHATAVRAFERVARHRPDAKLVLVGEGPEEGAIRDEVRRRGLESRVHLLGLRSDVARLLRGADLLLLTSVSEGIPLTLIEGMASGLPVVATRVGGVGEVVDEGRTGLLAPSGDDAALAALILRLAGDPALRARMGRLGRERASALFSESRMHAAYLQIYREMLRG